MTVSPTARRCACVVALLAMLAAATGCQSRTDTPQGEAPTSAVDTPTITITDFAYTVPDAVAPGAVVTLANDDGAEHSVTSDAAGVFDTDVQGRGSATFTAPMAPGTYAMHCTYHSRMRGVLVVR